MKKINIYGTGLNAMKFVLANKYIEIASFIEGRKEIKKFMSDVTGNMPVIKFEDAECILKKYYTIVASSEEAYWDIKENLENRFCLVEFEDFEYWETYHKKIATIYGNCHTSAVKTALKTSPVFNSIYGFYPLKPIQEIKTNNSKYMKTNVFQKCDLFIHQCIREHNTYGVQYASSNFIKLLNSKCMVIGIPNLYGMPRFLFPQISLDNNIVRWETYSFFPFRDKYIDANYPNKDARKIQDIINDDKLIDAASILESQERFWEKLKMREREWDIKVLDFLRTMITSHLLFYDPNHPTNIIIEYIANKILVLLKINDQIFDINNLLSLDSFQIPIYKSVSNILNLKYEIRYLRKYTRSKLCDNRMDLLEYIKQYIMWYYHPQYCIQQISKNVR